MVFNGIRRRAIQWYWQRHIVVVLLVLWGFFILYGTMLPFDFSASDELIQQRLRRLWERPLRGMGGSWADVYSNILFFMPWGFLLAIWRENLGTGWLATLAFALASGACLSGCVEFVQLFAPLRSTSVIDLITNTFGAFVGALLGWPLARWIWPFASIRMRQSLVTRPAAAVAATVAMGVIAAGLAPSYARKPTAGIAAALDGARLIPFGDAAGGLSPSAKAWLWGAELLTWTLIGGLGALAAHEFGRRGRRAVIWVIAITGGLSLAIEMMQLVVPGRDVDATSVVLAIVGSAVGASLLTFRSIQDTRRWTVPAILIWGLATLLASWNPPRFTWPDPPFWQPEMLVPFWSYFGNRSLADLADVTGQAILFMPLGALLAARSWRQSFLFTILVGLSFGVALELGQVFLPDRTADISDAISAAAGTGIGWAIWRWGEFARSSSMGATRYRVGARTGGRRA